jgi:tyrosyl-tRNA synthetase
MVLTTTLLENPVTKEKLMSKSLGTGIGLLESPDSMFGKIMAMPDEAIIQVFTDCTDLPLLKIKEYESSLKEGINPKDLKIELGKEIVRMYHSENEANLAAQNFENIFSKMQFPENAEVIVCDSAEKIIDILVNNGVVESKTEFRRLIEAGAVSDYPDKKITDSNEVVGQGQRKIKIGKRIFIILNPQ